MYQYARVRVSAFAAILIIGSANAQVLTVQVGSPPSPPTPLVSHGEIWAFHKGTNAPQANWQTIADGALNASWGGAAGGFGYGDAGISGEATTLSDMSNATTGYNTLYIRRSFTVGRHR